MVKKSVRRRCSRRVARSRSRKGATRKGATRKGATRKGSRGRRSVRKLVKMGMKRRRSSPPRSRYRPLLMARTELEEKSPAEQSAFVPYENIVYPDRTETITRQYESPVLREPPSLSSLGLLRIEYGDLFQEIRHYDKIFNALDHAMSFPNLQHFLHQRRHGYARRPRVRDIINIIKTQIDLERYHGIRSLVETKIVMYNNGVQTGSRTTREICLDLEHVIREYLENWDFQR
jgi:hypothetical protein